MTFGVPTEAPVEAAEAAEDVDGKPEKSGVSSRSPTEEIGLQRVPTATKNEQWSRGGGVQGLLKLQGRWGAMVACGLVDRGANLG